MLDNLVFKHYISKANCHIPTPVKVKELAMFIVLNLLSIQTTLLHNVSLFRNKKL